MLCIQKPPLEIFVVCHCLSSGNRQSYGGKEFHTILTVVCDVRYQFEMIEVYLDDSRGLWYVESVGKVVVDDRGRRREGVVCRTMAIFDFGL